MRESSSAADEQAQAAARRRLVQSPGSDLRPLTYRDMAWIPSEDTYWLEGVTLTCFLPSGDFILWNFVVSNMPFSKHRATLNLKMNPADGSPAVYFQRSFSSVTGMRWSEDRCSADFEDGSFFRCVLLIRRGWACGLFYCAAPVKSAHHS